MKEFVATKDGRRLSREDIDYLQELASAWGKVFSQYGDFVISGCVPTITNGNVAISSGWMFIDGRILSYAGGTYSLVDLYFGVSRSETKGEYVDNTNNTIRYEYKAAKESKDAHERQIEYKYDTQTGTLSYPTFENTVIRNQDYVPVAPEGGRSSIVDLAGILRLTAIYFSNNSCAVVPNGAEMFVSPNYNVSDDDKTGLLLFRNGNAVLTTTYPDNKNASANTQFGVGSVKCAKIFPLTYDESTTDYHGNIDSTDGKVNILGEVQSNGKKLLTEEKAEELYVTNDAMDISDLSVKDSATNVEIYLNITTRLCSINGFVSPTVGYSVGGVHQIKHSGMDDITPANPSAVYMPVYDLDDMAVVGYATVRNDTITIVFTQNASTAKGYVFNGSYMLPEDF